MKTLKYLFGAACAITVGAWVASTPAQAQTITGSPHDLRGQITAGTVEICAFCHTPHTTAGSAVPLWNRTAPDQATWTPYDSATIDLTISATPLGVSAGCLSCHDGITAYDSLLKNGGGIVATGTMGAGNVLAIGSGGDLTNDHPVSVTYEGSGGADPDFKDAVSGKVGALPLYASVTAGTFAEVECGTCHNPHDWNTVAPAKFLRIANTNSALCLTCHDK